LPENIRDPRPEELLPDVQRMQEAFVGLCRDAAAHGTAVVLEIMPFSNVRTLGLAALLSRALISRMA
jgi:hypothetical protein